MSKRQYDDYIKNGCHPTGYNEAVSQYYFGQNTVDFLLDKLEDKTNEYYKEKTIQSNIDFETLKEKIKTTPYIFIQPKQNSKQNEISIYIEQLEEKKEKLYFELLFTRLQWIHKKAEECREEKERFGGIEDMALDSVWRVLDLQKHECCEYEEMAELEEGIKTIAEDKLLRDIEHDLGVKVIRTENEIFNDIEFINNQIKQLKEKK